MYPEEMRVPPLGGNLQTKKKKVKPLPPVPAVFETFCLSFDTEITIFDHNITSISARTQNDPDLKQKKMFKYVVSARFLVSFKILWSSKRCLDDK